MHNFFEILKKAEKEVGSLSPAQKREAIDYFLFMKETMKERDAEIFEKMENAILISKDETKSNDFADFAQKNKDNEKISKLLSQIHSRIESEIVSCIEKKGLYSEKSDEKEIFYNLYDWFELIETTQKVSLLNNYTDEKENSQRKQNIKEMKNLKKDFFIQFNKLKESYPTIKTQEEKNQKIKNIAETLSKINYKKAILMDSIAGDSLCLNNAKFNYDSLEKLLKDKNEIRDDKSLERYKQNITNLHKDIENTYFKNIYPNKFSTLQKEVQNLLKTEKEIQKTFQNNKREMT